MKAWAYYNEIDPFAAAWLWELQSRNLIAPGEIDTRSIEDVTPDDLQGFTQCHFFAGIGGWSYALRLAGWPDDREVWTGSCPCQPFSAAGKRGGLTDARHLWPVWFPLIAICRPPVVFGEQVASPDGIWWWQFVSSDLEDAGYAVGIADLCAAGVGAPHIRQRLYWVADAVHAERRSVCLDGGDGRDRAHARRQEAHGEPRARGEVRRLADLHGAGLGGRRAGEASAEPGTIERSARLRAARGLGNADRELEGTIAGISGPIAATARDDVRPGPTNGHWGAADWLFCTDGKWRPVEPGTFPLAHGVPARVGRLRGYGNAIVPQIAAAFIRAYQEAI